MGLEVPEGESAECKQEHLPLSVLPGSQAELNCIWIFILTYKYKRHNRSTYLCPFSQAAKLSQRGITNILCVHGSDLRLPANIQSAPILLCNRRTLSHFGKHNLSYL